MRKKFLCICLVIMGIISLSGCSKKSDVDESKTRSYPVKAVEIQNSNTPISLHYNGLTGSSEVRKLSFKSAAKVSNIYVSKGQHVKKGDKLVDLDETDLQFAAQAAQAQMDAASAQYDKALNGAQNEDINKAQIAVNNAQTSYNYYKDLYNKNLQLYNSAAISKDQLDAIKLEMDASQNAVNAASQSLTQVQSGSRDEDKAALLAQVNAAKANYDAKEDLLSDASMTADEDGYVVDILCKQGEMQAAGMPVILFRGENQVVTVGLSEDDIKKVQVGTKAQVQIGSDKSEGQIINVVQMADKQSGTYTAEIQLSKPVDNNKFYVGETADVSFDVGEQNSICVPISSVLNDGEDYVYVIEKGHAIRKDITLGDAFDDKVAVTGLKVGDKLVTQGMKNLKPGYKVIEK